MIVGLPVTSQGLKVNSVSFCLFCISSRFRLNEDPECWKRKLMIVRFSDWMQTSTFYKMKAVESRYLYAYILSEKGGKRLEKNHSGDGSICTPDKKDVSVVEG